MTGRSSDRYQRDERECVHFFRNAWKEEAWNGRDKRMKHAKLGKREDEGPRKIGDQERYVPLA